MPAPQIILDLVQRFHDSREQYRSGRYNEAQLRREFLDPFFAALGWDLTNAQNNAPQYREVIQEDTVEIEGQAKAPDYAFGIFGVRKFFVEAKKPAVNIRYDIYPAFQLRRYAWSAHLPLSILTDFEEFAVYDTRVKPDHKDNASVARTMLFTYTEYAERWDEIASIFSKEAILKGSFDRYVQDNKAKKGTAEVDDDFLKSIENWRTLLARNIALRNPSARSESALNYAVQMTIDRLIFLRICEDRGIEPENQLRDLTTSPGIYPRLVNLYIKADQKYNSGLFHFKSEKGQTSGEDTFTTGLVIDDKVLKEIITSLYYPESAYAFNVIPVEILGQVYEQFLGKVIRLTAGGSAKIEEKPEVRKAGGVYYTPRYIVDYIVENTVGKLLEGKIPREAAELRIVDPACGSGSFLLGAYQYLLDWHHKYYLDPMNGGADSFTHGRKPVLAQRAADEYYLTTAEKKRILVNNIYGVDLDHQAVEVTKLSLLLKLLEEETGQLSLGFERVLPDLGHNIRCGNSLIGWDYFGGQLLADDEEVKRINPFNWQEAFPEVFSKGGFDVVIGNPPYIRIQTMLENDQHQVKIIRNKYRVASKGNIDIYLVFVEKGLEVVNRNGTLGFIIPNKFFTANYGVGLRTMLTDGNHISRIVHFGAQQVFVGATTYTCLLFLTTQQNKVIDFLDVLDIHTWKSTKTEKIIKIPSQSLSGIPWVLASPEDNEIFEKLKAKSRPLIEASERIFQGLKTGADTVFILENVSENSYYSSALSSQIELESILLKPLYKSGEFKRYKLFPNKRSIIFPYENGNLLSWATIVNRAPRTANYLLRCKKILIERENGKWNDHAWYRYSRSQAFEVITRPKILTADINPFANYCVDESGHVYFTGGTAGGYGIILNETVDPLLTLGFLNSSLVDYYHKKKAQLFRGGWFAYDAKAIRETPIFNISNLTQNNKLICDEIKQLVSQIINLNRQFPTSPLDVTLSSKYIKSLENRIDQLVYELYELTMIEIAKVKSSI